MTPIAFLVAKFGALGVPEPLRKAAAWATLILAVLALLMAVKAIYDRSVIEDHEKDRAVQSIDARDHSAEERADDAVRNILADKEREAAIAKAALQDAAKAPEDRAKLPPTTVALNCKRLEQAYSAKDLEAMQIYREVCK